MFVLCSNCSLTSNGACTLRTLFYTIYKYKKVPSRACTIYGDSSRCNLKSPAASGFAGTGFLFGSSQRVARDAGQDKRGWNFPSQGRSFLCMSEHDLTLSSLRVLSKLYTAIASDELA